MLDWTRVNKGRTVIGVSGVKIDKMQARSQDFSWGGVHVGSEDANL